MKSVDKCESKKRSKGEISQVIKDNNTTTLKVKGEAMRVQKYIS